MKKSELRKNYMEKEMTINKARKELLKVTSELKDYQVFVRCNTYQDYKCDLITCLAVEVQDNDTLTWWGYVIASIVAPSNIMEGWEFLEKSQDIFKTMKKNTVKELERVGYININTEDYWE